MIRIEVKSSEVNSRNGTKNGRDWSMRTQEAWAHTVERSGNVAPYPQKMIITLERDQAAYPVGNYTLEPQSLYIGDFSSLRLGTPVLKKLEPKSNLAAA